MESLHILAKLEYPVIFSRRVYELVIVIHACCNREGRDRYFAKRIELDVESL